MINLLLLYALRVRSLPKDLIVWYKITLASTFEVSCWASVWQTGLKITVKKNLSRLLWFSCTFTDTFIERRIYFIKYLYSSTWSVKKKKKKKSFYQNDTKCNREYISQIYWDIFWSNLIKSLFRMPSKGDGKAWTH